MLSVRTIRDARQKRSGRGSLHRPGRWCVSRRSARLPPAILHRDPMKVQWKKQSGPLLISSFNLVQPKRGREEPTMTRATRTAEYTGSTALCLYLAFELGSHEWKLGFTTEPGATPRGRTMPARDLARLTRGTADAKNRFGVKAG